MQPSISASIRNWSSTSRSRAPMASRMPISRVRSVTDTSMMFMMPMPPTSRLTAATAASSVVMICVVDATLAAISTVSRIWKLSSSPSERLRLSRMSSVTASRRRSRSDCGFTETRRAPTRFLPRMRRWSVLIGMTSRSSWSPPMAAVPLVLRRPTTLHEKLPVRMVRPMTSAPSPNSSF